LFLTTQLPSNGLAADGPTKAGYTVAARFENIGDLKTGSPVTMAGVRIGVVQLIRFDPKDYKAVVTMRLDPQYNQIPEDSFASIQTQGLLGRQVRRHQSRRLRNLPEERQSNRSDAVGDRAGESGQQVLCRLCQQGRG
jgi:hypothetical protein